VAGDGNVCDTRAPLTDETSMHSTLLRSFLFLTCVAPIWAQSTPATPFCLGDGSFAPCPCGPNGAVGHGCANLDYATGPLLTASGVAGASAATDTLVLTASDIAGVGWFLQADGLAATPAPFGHGFICATAGVRRLSLVFPIGHTSTLPGGPNPLPIHVEGFVNSGDVKHYQCWYRDPIMVCGTTFNITAGLTIVWGP
jgi:hypothetical protein